MDLIEEKMAILEKTIREAQQAASEETKSSAGDKFETAREMIKLEINKNSLQLSKAADMLKYLRQIKPEDKKEKVEFGSLVTTNEGHYYFSIGLGKVMVDKQTFFALSMASPIGKALQGHQAGEEILFMGRTIKILQIE